MDNPLKQIESLIPLIEKVAADMATKIVEQKLKEAQYSVPKVPDHHHDGTDSIQLEPTAVSGIVTLSANSQSTVAKSGVVSAKALGDQNVTQGPTNIAYLTPGTTSTSFGQQAVKGTVFSSPIPIIYGHGAGAASAFNGGIAPEGTVIFFNNGPTLSGFWVRSGGSWIGVGQSTAGYTSTIF